MTYYQELISEMTAKAGRSDINPRHVEAFMRLEHSTLDGLSRRRFNQEVKIGIACIDQIGAEEAEETARSFGL